MRRFIFRLAFTMAMAMAQAAFAQGTPSSADAALKRGKLLYIQCRACHELAAGRPHRVGPNLHGFLARDAATAPGFAYSVALRKANLKWDKSTLEKWLEKPAALAPGNSMAFAGIASPSDRAALIAYLTAETGSASP